MKYNKQNEREVVYTYNMMDQRINSAVYVKVLSKPMNFQLSVSPRKEIGDCTRHRKNLRPRRESNPRPPDLIVRCSTD